MELYNIIKILPNIYLSNNYNIDKEFINNNGIKTIILINSNDNNETDNNNDFDKINISITEINFDFDKINNLIIDCLKKSKNILIISEKNLIGFIIISSFMIEKLDISFFKILILDKYYNIHMTKTNYYKLLQTYYNNKKIFKLNY